MILTQYPASSFDELSRGTDASTRSADHRIEAGRVAFGALSAADSTDYFQITPGAGSFALVVSADPANGFASSITVLSKTGNSRVPANARLASNNVSKSAAVRGPGVSDEEGGVIVPLSVNLTKTEERRNQIKEDRCAPSGNGPLPWPPRALR